MMQALIPYFLIMLQIKIILASVREGRFGDKPAKWILDLVNQQEGLHAELLDLKEYQMPFFNDPVSPSMMKEPYKNPEVARWTEKIAEADAFIVVTPEYNHAPPASLKNAIDWVGKEWNNKPMAFVAYGGVGGARAVEQLRQIMVELQVASMQRSVNITFDFIMKAMQEPTIAPAELLNPLEQKAVGMIDQLVWWGNALKEARSK